MDHPKGAEFNKRVELIDGDRLVAEVAVNRETYVLARLDPRGRINYSRMAATGLVINDGGRGVAFESLAGFLAFVEANREYLEWLIERPDSPRPSTTLDEIPSLLDLPHDGPN